MLEDRSSYKLLYSPPVIVAALGYFVDIYDLLLFAIVRKSSLISLGVPEAELFEKGEYLLQTQMFGMLVGGIIWGIMGDKRGRLSVLFGSILLYSLANIANGFVTTVDQYAALRFIAGVGLAGELGAGITLVSEILPKQLRGYGTAIVAGVGVLGAVAGNFVSRSFDSWQVSYFVGGGMGLLLLIARVSVMESGVFLKVREKEGVSRGNFFQLFTNRKRLVKFLGCIFIGLPIWFTIGILVSFSPEFAKALSIPGTITTGDAIMYSYIGLCVGDLGSGIISQLVRSRKKVALTFILMTACLFLLYLFMPVRTATFFYITCFALGISIGYWALFVTIAAEQFGTNLRSTVATTTPNFIRGTVIPLIWMFKLLRDSINSHYLPSLGESAAYSRGMIYGALIVGAMTIVIACIALLPIDETFGRDMNFEEET
jgi:MFS family permease